MSKALIEKLRKARDEDRSGADTLLAKLEADPTSTLSDTEQKNLDSLVASATELDARIASLTAIEMARIEASNLDAKFDGAEVVQKATFQIAERPKDLGSQFVDSDAFKSFAESPSGNSGRMTANLGLTSQFAVATAVESGDLPVTSRAKDVQSGIQKTPLLDAMGYEPVGSNSIEWIEYPVDPEGTVTAENVTKTESDYTPVLKTGALEKIAHHTPFTREIMEDVPRFTAMLNGALLRGVRRKAETNAAAALVAATLPAHEQPVDSGGLTAGIRVGMATVETAGFYTDTVVMNPFDYAEVDIDLLTATLAGARVNSSIWGINIVPATAVAEGTAYVGDFQTAMTLFDRQNMAIYLTDSHAAEFIDNVLRALAEARMKAAVVMPAALCEVTVAAPV